MTEIEKWATHDGCGGCAYVHLEDPCEPCKQCIGTAVGEYERNRRKDCYISGSNVNHPAHYNTGNIECIDAMVSAFGAEETATFCLINAFKYVWRLNNKNGVEDAEKAVWYLNKYLELKKGEIKEI